jgi:small acid-soluble spore protein F (minor alpha/beta-type SASP)
MQIKQKAAAAATAKALRVPRELSPLELLKLEVVAELGLAEKVSSEGWGNLTARETGRIGGMLNKRLKDRNMSIGPKGMLMPLE